MVGTCYSVKKKRYILVGMYLFIGIVGNAPRCCNTGSQELVNVFNVRGKGARAGNIRSALWK
jgi:hypothetical protein